MLDTNICIYILNNRPAQVREKFMALDSEEIGLSSIVVGELAFGASQSSSPHSRDKLHTFLAPLQLLKFDDAAAWHWGEIRGVLKSAGTPIGHYDAQIAAHARALDITLITNNEREFKRVPGLKIENWIS
jgi:tRNA(fMet)-specific endonuclease VapC